MMETFDNMAFACLVGAVICFVFLVVGGIVELIDYLTKGKFKDSIVNLLSEND